MKEGISVPIDVKLRPAGMGIGHNGFEERKPDLIKKEKTVIPKRGERWKKGLKKRKEVYRTAVEVLQEINYEPVSKSKIRDMRGKEEKVLIDMSDMTSTEQEGFPLILKQVPSISTRLPELIHNIILISTIAKKDLLYVHNQQRIEMDAQSTRRLNHDRTHMIMHEEGLILERVKEVLYISKQIQSLIVIHAVELASPSLDPSIISTLFGPSFKSLVPYMTEYHQYQIDHLVVGVMSSILKVSLRSWSPLVSPLYCMDIFEEFKGLLLSNDKEVGWEEMNPFETLLYTVWMPRLRTTYNNDWDVSNPDAVIELLEGWRSSKLLPNWLYSNIITQLILPKLERALESWTARQSPIHIWIFPWLPMLGDKLENLKTLVRRKLQMVCRSWIPTDPQAMSLYKIWVQVWTESDSTAFLTTPVIPALITHLRNLVIDPSNQDLSCLEVVCGWSIVIPDHLFSTLLATEFFPKWTETLWAWLQSPSANLDEIGTWYRAWKSWFKSNGIDRLKGVKEGFRRGLDMMNQGVSNYTFVEPSVGTIPKKSRLTEETLSFKDLIGILCAESDVEFVPTGKVREGKDLYRMGKLHVYVDDGVLYVRGENGYQGMGVEEAISSA